MKVGVIAAELEGPSTGVGRYLQGLLTGLQSWEHGFEWHLFFQHQAPAGLPTPSGCIYHNSGDRGNRVLWEQVKLSQELARHDLDVVFCPAYSVPLGIRAPSVVTMHDLSFELVPHEFGFRERWRRRILARRAVRRAARVLTDTTHMATVVTRRYGVRSHRLAVVPLGIDRRCFSPQNPGDDQRVLEELGVRPPYLLWLGTVLERRMPREVLAAFSGLRNARPNLRLVIAGDNRMRSPARLEGWIRDLGLEDDVLLPGWVEESCLGPLYRCAEAGVYLSRHEGFGIPPMECLACGTPVVVSNGLALDEMWPDYPFRCSDLTARAIENVMDRVLSPDVWNDEMASAAEQMVAGLDWGSSSKLLVSELEKAVVG